MNPRFLISLLSRLHLVRALAGVFLTHPPGIESGSGE